MGIKASRQGDGGDRSDFRSLSIGSFRQKPKLLEFNETVGRYSLEKPGPNRFQHGSAIVNGETWENTSKQGLE